MLRGWPTLASLLVEEDEFDLVLDSYIVVSISLDIELFVCSVYVLKMSSSC